MEGPSFSEYNKSVEESSRSRKRSVNPEQWVKNKKKVARNSISDRGRPRVDCDHNAEYCQAGSLTNQDVESFSRKLYSSRSKQLPPQVHDSKGNSKQET